MKWRIEAKCENFVAVHVFDSLLYTWDYVIALMIASKKYTNPQHWTCIISKVEN